MQYLVELVRSGVGLAVLPPMAVQPVADSVNAVPITPPLRRDLFAVVAAGRAPTGPAQALLDLLGSPVRAPRA